MKINLGIIILSLAIFSCTSLPYTIEKGKTVDARTMINDGADVNDSSACFHALTIAAMKGNKDLVQLLVEKGADVNARSKECKYTQNLIGMKFKFLWGSRTALDRVANAEIARILLKAGAIPNISGYRDFKSYSEYDTALSNAIKKRDLDLVKTLVEGGANINVRNRAGKNLALMYARIYAKSNKNATEPKAKQGIEILNYLKSNGARELPLTADMAKTTNNKILYQYKHVATGAITVMPQNLAKMVYNNPGRFSGLTINAADKKAYHYYEFVWTKTGQNMFEWFLLRKKETGALK